MSMLIASQIRKQILLSLENHILPDLSQRPITQILVSPPFDALPVPVTTLQEEALPAKQPTSMRMICHWKHEKLVASYMPVWAIVYEGEMRERIGLTAELSAGQAAPGISEIKLQAPSLIFYPPGIGHNSGEPSCWLRDPKENLSFRTMWLHSMVDEVLVHLQEVREGVYWDSHSLRVSDPQLAYMERIYAEELCFRDNPAAQPLLLSFMHRLHRRLMVDEAELANSCWPQAPELAGALPRNSERHRDLFWNTAQYIQTHLDGPLSLTMLSERAGISPNMLNRIFKGAGETTVMRYVMQRRIDAAKQMLTEGSAHDERIGEVAALLGFPSAACFTMIFRKTTGFSPREFRRRERKLSDAVAK